jgi:NhaB family Na+:H+ antiporter
MPGGLLALEALLLGLATPAQVYEEVKAGLPVILLVIFMVAGVHFLRDFLFLIVSRVLLGISSRMLLALMLSVTMAFLSAFLDALTLLAVLITTMGGFYEAYHRSASGRGSMTAHDIHDDDAVQAAHRVELEQFRAFLRSMVMHAAVGTTLGGIWTLVGEPQNLVIGASAGWGFAEYARQVFPVTLPVLIVGLATCLVLERSGWFGYGHPLPVGVRHTLEAQQREIAGRRNPRERLQIAAQALAALALVAALALHLAEIGLIGLALLVVAATMNGVNDEHRVARAFHEGMPFASLLVVFFAIVAVIHAQHLFQPVIEWVLSLSGQAQALMLYITNGILSAVSDNVFVATIYASQFKEAFDAGLITREAFDLHSVAIAIGTNVPSMATPNGQAAFLFLLTSTLAIVLRLSYLRMVWMALPYVVTTSLTGYVAIAALAQ